MCVGSTHIMAWHQPGGSIGHHARAASATLVLSWDTPQRGLIDYCAVGEGTSADTHKVEMCSRVCGLLACLLLACVQASSVSSTEPGSRFSLLHMLESHVLHVRNASAVNSAINKLILDGALHFTTGHNAHLTDAWVPDGINISVPRPCAANAPPGSRFIVCAPIRDHAWLLTEFVVHHLWAGAQKVVLIDDRSVDNLADVAEPWIKAGLLSIVPFPDALRAANGDFMHTDGLNQGCHQGQHAAGVDWVMYLDMDEYLMPVGGACISDIVAAHYNAASQCGVHIRRHNFKTSSVMRQDHRTRFELVGFTRGIPGGLNKPLCSTRVSNGLASNMPHCCGCMPDETRRIHATVNEDGSARLPETACWAAQSTLPRPAMWLQVNHFQHTTIEAFIAKKVRDANHHNFEKVRENFDLVELISLFLKNMNNDEQVELLPDDLMLGNMYRFTALLNKVVLGRAEWARKADELRWRR
ncbi:hypothetical protein FOA52_000721 [Chlamydomonas sp. UWO 241]|nr:hypothetical protein FOA52_000721 [Chlamydomonas sp. UWO 241]